ncbi:hypothetical protein V8D89_002566 [Ganoderma adspersum]
MPLLTHLAILHQHSWCGTASTFTLNLPNYPNVQALEFEDTYFYTPLAPYPSLCHLKLKHCAIRTPPTAGGTIVHAVYAVHNALGLFPNLETLSLVYSLSDDNPHGLSDTLPELTETVHLPHLRHLELEDIPAYIPGRFLSHLVFPASTSLVLEPAYMRDFSRRPPAAPLFPGINQSPTPTAELSLCLYSRRRTHGDGVRPVRVAFPSANCRTHNAKLVARFTRELAAALAPAPAPGVTSLVVQPGTHWSPSDWKRLMVELPGLRRLACPGSPWSSATVIDVLGERSDPGHGEFVCTRLTDLALVWSIPHQACLGAGVGERGSLRQQDDATRPEKPAEGSQSWLAASLSEFCDALRTCFTERAGHCEPIRKLSVSPYWELHQSSSGGVLEGWQAALVEQRLRHVLGHWVGDVVVVAAEQAI